MKQFLTSLLHHLHTALHISSLEDTLRLTVELCSWHPSPEVSFAIRLVADLAGNEGVRLWVRWTARVFWARLLAVLARSRRR